MLAARLTECRLHGLVLLGQPSPAKARAQTPIRIVKKLAKVKKARSLNLAFFVILHVESFYIFVQPGKIKTIV